MHYFLSPENYATKIGDVYCNISIHESSAITPPPPKVHKAGVNSIKTGLAIRVRQRAEIFYSFVFFLDFGWLTFCFFQLCYGFFVPIDTQLAFGALYLLCYQCHSCIDVPCCISLSLWNLLFLGDQMVWLCPRSDLGPSFWVRFLLRGVRDFASSLKWV